LSGNKSIILLNLVKTLVTVACCGLPLLGVAQTSPSRAELEKNKEQLQRELNRANRELLQTKNNRRLTLGQLRLLQKKISLRNKLIENINEDIGLFDQAIRSAYRDISLEKKDLDTLKTQYARMVVYSYMTRSAYDYVNFILSSKSFNDAIRRYEYLKQYRSFRLNQAASIVQTENLLKEKIHYMALQRKSRSGVLGSQEKEKRKLEQEKQEKNEFMANLKGHEKELMADIREKERAQMKLSRTLSILIRREIEEARRNAAASAASKKNPVRVVAPGAASSGTGNAIPHPAAVSAGTVARPANPLEATPESLALSENFESNRGKLPWPVKNGFISDPFGPHQHPLLDKVEVDNYGVNISTDPNGVVRAVFKGDVVTAANDQYTKWTVLVRHGEYFTVYSNLARVFVKKGQTVTTKQPIGVAYTNTDTGETYVHFLVMKNGTFLNPALWLMSR